MQVIKRNGKKEDFSLDKIHQILGWAVEGIEEVSVSDIEMHAQLNIYDGIPTEEIHEVLIKSAADLISEETTDYQYVAARLALYNLRKKVWGSDQAPRLHDHILSCLTQKVYDPEILQWYSESEIHKLGKYIKHDRDDLFTYAGVQQLIDKYLIKNRDTGEIYETPQFAYMLIAMTAFHSYKENRIQYIKKCYDYISTFKINLPTPLMAGLRTPIRQFASCILIDVGDSLDSIFSSVNAVAQYTAKRAGIGINVGRIRPIGSQIRAGEVRHTGLLPYLRVFQSTVKSTSQNGIRGGGATVNIPFWNVEIEDVVPLKNNAGTDENRIRQMDYCVQLSKLFYQRFLDNEEITLLSPHECPEVYNSFGMEDFDEKYKTREKDTTLKFKNKIKARDLMALITKERLETGRIYIMNIDHANTHSSFLNSIKMTNLCTEVLFPTKPLNHIDDMDAEIGVCILSAINLLETKIDEFEDVANIIVRVLDSLIDFQTYPVKAAENFCKNRRSLGVGFTNLAGFLAKNKLTYDNPESLKLINTISEKLQYSLLKASVELAKEFGKCDYYKQTKYSIGILPIDTYCKEVDKLINESNCDWESLRKEIDEHGLRHSTVTAQMPCESSSVLQNSTNGIEPVRDVISYKKAKTGNLKQVVPNYKKFSKYYTKAFDIQSNKTMTDIGAVIQKWFDQGVSLNHYYNYSHYPNKNIPKDLLIKDLIYAYKMGLKTLYYSNSTETDVESSCPSGACSI